MSIAYNASIVRDNLVLLVDSANSKSYVNGENLVVNSTNLLSGWTASSAGIVSTTTTMAPDGSYTAFKLYDTTGTNFHYLAHTNAVSINSGTQYTFSVYVKPAELTRIGVYIPGGNYGSKWDLSNNNPTLITNDGGVMTSYVTAAPYGWFRISATYNANLTGTYSPTLYLMNPSTGFPSASTGTGMYIWQPQFEVSAQPTTFLPTTGTARPRQNMWLDLSSNANHLTVSGTTVSMSSGTFYTSTATAGSSYVWAPSFFGTNSATNVSYSLMIKANWASNQYYQTLFGLQGGSFTSVATLNFDNTPGLVSLDFRNNGASNRGILVTDLNAYSNRFCMLTWTFNSGTHVLYVNDQQVNAATGSITQLPNWPTGNSTNGFCIGSNIDSHRYIGDANVAWAAVYRKTLSLDDVRQNFNALRGRYGI